MNTKYILGQIGENGKPRTIVVEEGVAPKPKLRSVAEVAEKWHEPEVIEDVLTTDRAHIAAVLIEGLESKHVREMQPGENRAKYLAFVRGEEHMKRKAIALIKATLDVTSEEK